MNKSFSVGQSNELVLGEKVYDLHNCYNVSGVSLAANRTLQMFFIPDSQWGGDYSPIVLEFTGVDFLEFKLACHANQAVDLHEMGYKSLGDQDDAWLLTEEQATPQDHLFFRLGGDNYVRIHSKNAVLIEKTTGNNE